MFVSVNDVIVCKNNIYLRLDTHFAHSPLPIFLRAHAIQALEELAEGRGVGKVEVVSNLGDAQLGGLQQEGGLHQ